MKASIILEYKDRYVSKLRKLEELDNEYLFEIISNWQQHFDIEAIDLLSSFQQALESSISKHLWGGSKNSVKENLEILISADKELMRLAFRDLFSEGKDLGLRLDRFAYHLHEIFKSQQRKNPLLIDHGLQNRKLYSLLLTTQYPSQYCLFDYTNFQWMMQVLESRNIPSEVELERYFKSLRGIFKLITKDDAIATEYARLVPEKYLQQELPLVVMNDFMLTFS